MTIRGTFFALALATAALGGGCDKQEGGGSTALAKYPGTQEGAKALLTDIRTGDAQAMTRALKPTKADYEAVFDGQVAGKLATVYEELWKDPKAVIGAKPENTELKLWSATTDELRQGTGASEEFPGGYKKAAAQLKPGLTFYRWKYTKPGESLGMAYDGLVHVNGHWAWFPKPWRALEQASK